MRDWQVRTFALSAVALALAGCSPFSGTDTPSDAGGLTSSFDASGADAYRAAVLADAPRSYWRLDETSGPAAKDEMGKVDGMYSGGCTFKVAGAVKTGTAVGFDGTSCNVDLGANFRFAGKAPFSIEAWVLADPAAGGYNHVFTHEHRNGAPTDGYAILLDTPRSTYAERIGSNGNENTDSATLDSGQFSHLVLAYDGGTLTVYVNGVASKSRAATGVATDIGDHAFIGCAGTSNFFQGTIDEVAVYDKALSPTRVKAHYDARL